MAKNHIPIEDYAKEQINVAKQTAKMQKDLNKFSRPAIGGGRVWTVGDMARYFDSVKKRRKKK